MTKKKEAMTTNGLNKKLVMIIWEKNIFHKGKKKIQLNS